MKLFGDYIRELREKQNLPLRKVAAFIDVDTSILSKIERGERTATRENICGLADFFSINRQALWDDYMGEYIAKMIYREKNSNIILDTARKKTNYLKYLNQKQAKISFKNE